MMEFCPFCDKRTTMSCASVESLSCASCKLNNDSLEIYNDKNKLVYSINLLNNKFTHYYSEKEYNKLTSVLGQFMMLLNRQCNKYHFLYNGRLKLNLLTMTAEITLNKINFLRNYDDTHYVVNVNYIENNTNIRVTSSYKTRELVLPIIDFDFSSKKKMAHKLKNIDLLG